MPSSVGPVTIVLYFSRDLKTRGNTRRRSDSKQVLLREYGSVRIEFRASSTTRSGSFLGRNWREKFTVRATASDSLIETLCEIVCEIVATMENKEVISFSVSSLLFRCKNQFLQEQWSSLIVGNKIKRTRLYSRFTRYSFWISINFKSIYFKYPLLIVSLLILARTELLQFPTYDFDLTHSVEKFSKLCCFFFFFF